MSKNITKVPDGPLIKKKGPFKGSTLKNGGPIKKEVNTVVKDKTAVKKPDAVKIMKGDNEIAVRKQNNNRKIADYNRKMDVSAALMYGDENGSLLKDASKQDSISKSAVAKARSLRKNPKFKLKSGGPVKKAKAGAMIKRADGSTSQRGLWDNIRANKGSGKKPTAAMLKQEKKIKAKAKK